MADNEVKKEESNDIDVSMFITEDGANVLSSDQLKELNKKLPKWNIKPPARYIDKN